VTRNASQTRRDFLKTSLTAAVLAGVPRLLSAGPPGRPSGKRPTNFVLCMTDDQGYGDAGFMGHPVLKTPNLDAMAANGLVMDRFYAANPVCTPTRISVLTGRAPARSACFSTGPGDNLRAQELILPGMMSALGYATGHFGKFHLKRSPSKLGYDTVLHHEGCNFFEANPELILDGEKKQYTGDTSDIVVDEALKFMRRAQQAGKPFLAVIWFPSPHSPHEPLPEDAAPYRDLPDDTDYRPKRGKRGDPAAYLGELAGVDRAMGTLRAALREMKVHEDTLVWFNSDNGGSHGSYKCGLSGGKGHLSEGGIRVPGVIEWPARIREGRRTRVPAATYDILPTVLAACGADLGKMTGHRPIDGISLLPLIDGTMERRDKPLFFWRGVSGLLKEIQHGQTGKMQAFLDDPRNSLAVIDNEYKLMSAGKKPRKGVETPPDGMCLFNVETDKAEKNPIDVKEPERRAAMREALLAWQRSVGQSISGADYRD